MESQQVWTNRWHKPAVHLHQRLAAAAVHLQRLAGALLLTQCRIHFQQYPPEAQAAMAVVGAPASLTHQRWKHSGATRCFPSWPRWQRKTLQLCHRCSPCCKRNIQTLPWLSGKTQRPSRGCSERLPVALAVAVVLEAWAAWAVWAAWTQ